MAVAGVGQDQMARVLGISEPTLRKYYHETIDNALIKTISSVSNTLVQKALAGDTASIIFFLKVRGKAMGWTERLEVLGPGLNGEHKVTVTADDAFAAFIATLGGHATAPAGSGDGEGEVAGEGAAQPDHA